MDISIIFAGTKVVHFGNSQTPDSLNGESSKISQQTFLNNSSKLLKYNALP